MGESRMCEQTVRSGTMWARYDKPCGKRAKVERDGKWYCGVHDPEKREARNRERTQRIALEAAVSRAQWNITSAEKLLAEAVASYGGELPKPIAEARTILLARRASLRSCKTQLDALTPQSEVAEPETSTNV